VTFKVLTNFVALGAKQINRYCTDNVAPPRTGPELRQYVGRNLTRLPCRIDRISLHYTYLLSPTSFRITVKRDQALLDHSDDLGNAVTLEFPALLAQHADRILTMKLCRTCGM
jgi:hypothetical protein